MGVNTYLLLCLAFATRLRIAHAEIDKECIYEGQRFTLDRAGQLPLETHRNFDFGECKDLCKSNPTCIIWQWQPTRKICWIMNVKPYLDKNSDFGIGHCNKGQPTGNSPICDIAKGDRNNVWKDYKDITKEECITKCDDDFDCLIWQHIKNKKLCRIHKLEVDTSKKSLVGIHYCLSSMPPYICGESNRVGHGPVCHNTLRFMLGQVKNCHRNHNFEWLLAYWATLNPQSLKDGTLCRDVLEKHFLPWDGHGSFPTPEDAVRASLKRVEQFGGCGPLNTIVIPNPQKPAEHVTFDHNNGNYYGIKGEYFVYECPFDKKTKEFSCIVPDGFTPGNFLEALIVLKEFPKYDKEDETKLLRLSQHLDTVLYKNGEQWSPLKIPQEMCEIYKEPVEFTIP